jgi:predicted nucleic acid-binding protein
VIHYLDTSALVKRYVLEPGSRTVREIVRRRTVAVSRIAYAELASAVARLQREGELDARGRDQILARLDEDFASFTVVEVRPAIVRRVPALVVQRALRGYDAVHLASALAVRDQGAALTFWSADRALVGAATSFGLKATPVLA